MTDPDSSTNRIVREVERFNQSSIMAIAAMNLIVIPIAVWMVFQAKSLADQLPWILVTFYAMLLSLNTLGRTSRRGPQ